MNKGNLIKLKSLVSSLEQKARNNQKISNIHIGCVELEGKHQPICMITTNRDVGANSHKNRIIILAGYRDGFGSFKEKGRNRNVVTLDDLSKHPNSKRVKKTLEVASDINKQLGESPIDDIDKLCDAFINAAHATHQNKDLILIR